MIRNLSPHWTDMPLFLQLWRWQLSKIAYIYFLQWMTVQYKISSGFRAQLGGRTPVQHMGTLTAPATQTQGSGTGWKPLQILHQEEPVIVLFSMSMLHPFLETVCPPKAGQRLPQGIWFSSAVHYLRIVCNHTKLEISAFISQIYKGNFLLLILLVSVTSFLCCLSAYYQSMILGMSSCYVAVYTPVNTWCVFRTH